MVNIVVIQLVAVCYVLSLLTALSALGLLPAADRLLILQVLFG